MLSYGQEWDVVCFLPDVPSQPIEELGAYFLLVPFYLVLIKTPCEEY